MSLGAMVAKRTFGIYMNYTINIQSQKCSTSMSSAIPTIILVKNYSKVSPTFHLPILNLPPIVYAVRHGL